MNNKKLLGVLLFVAVVVAIYLFTPLRDILSRENLENLKIWIQAQGVMAPFVFVAIYVFATVFALPGSVLTLLGGLIFGVGWGLVLVVVASNLGAFLAFLVARYLGRQTAQKLLRGSVGKLDKGIEEKGFYVVLWLRLVPVFPFNALNYALGLTKVKVKHLMLGNFLGMFPGTFVYVSLGNAASQVSLTDPSVWTKIEVWGPFALVILLSLLPKILKRKH